MPRHSMPWIDLFSAPKRNNGQTYHPKWIGEFDRMWHEENYSNTNLNKPTENECDKRKDCFNSIRTASDSDSFSLPRLFSGLQFYTVKYPKLMQSNAGDLFCSRMIHFFAHIFSCTIILLQWYLYASLYECGVASLMFNFPIDLLLFEMSYIQL